MRLLFVTHYFHPEIGAPQTRILETARMLGERGHSVVVETGFPNYPDGVIPPEYRGALFRKDHLDGMEIRRSPVYPARNSGFARRLLNHASLAATIVPAAVGAGPVDVVIAESPPLFTAAAGVAVAKMHRAPLVLNVADLWPESAVQLGALRDRRAIALAERLERFCYSHSAAVTVPTNGMREILVKAGQPPGRVIHLPNAVDVERFNAGDPPATVPSRVVYCGTVGMAQGVGTLLDAAAHLQRTGDAVEIVIAGDGAERPELEARALSEGLASVRFLGRLPREEVPALIASADMTVVSLRDVPLFEDAVPTKMLEYMASARPVIAAASGEAARLVTSADGGVPCPPEDPAALADAIRSLTGDHERARRLGVNGRRYVEERLSRRAFVDQLERVLQDVAAG